jgi:nucleotide-binding universal stress UspA family protein
MGGISGAWQDAVRTAMTDAPPLSSYRNILVAYDDSDGARAALRRATALATGGGAALTLVRATSGGGGVAGAAHVPGRHPPPEHVAETRHSLERAIAALDPELEANPWVVGGPAAKAIVAVARDIGADLLITGSRGRGTVGRALLGSVSTELVHDAPCDVLVAHPAAE